MNSSSDSATITSINGSSVTPISHNSTSVTMTSSDAYSLLGFTGADNSNSFINWAGAELSVNGITATSFTLFEYAIPVTLSAKGTDTFQFSGLPAGTFVIAEGDDSQHMYDTPFTMSGLTGDAVPEPSSAVLLGMGICMFFVGFVTWKRRSSSLAGSTKG